MEKSTKEFLDSLLPVMSPSDQKKCLQQLVKQANKDSRKQALLDPLARIPVA